MLLAIDPGNVESAYVLIGKDLTPLEFGKIPNKELLDVIPSLACGADYLALEMVASYGMAVGETVFETVFWAGRFWQAAEDRLERKKVYRKEVKMNLCHSMRAKDANIRQALIDRFGEVGVKKNPGFFYGFKADIWAAYAVGVTYHDLYLR